MQQQVAARQKNIDLTVNNLQPGRYFIKISNSTEVITQSFVIVRID
jgi:hypothetical protein